jgi:hypothetical protein
VSALADVLRELRDAGLLSRAVKVKAGDIEVLMEQELPETPTMAPERTSREEQAAVFESMYGAARGDFPDAS